MDVEGKTRTETETGVEVTAESMAKEALENEMNRRAVVGFVTEDVVKSKESERYWGKPKDDETSKQTAHVL